MKNNRTNRKKFIMRMRKMFARVGNKSVESLTFTLNVNPPPTNHRIARTMIDLENKHRPHGRKYNRYTMTIGGLEDILYRLGEKSVAEHRPPSSGMRTLEEQDRLRGENKNLPSPHSST